MSRFLQAASDPEEEEEEQQEVQAQVSKVPENKKKKDNKKKDNKKKTDDIIKAQEQPEIQATPSQQIQNEQANDNGNQEEEAKQESKEESKDEKTKNQKKKDKKKTVTANKVVEPKVEKEKPMNAIAKLAYERKQAKDAEEARMKEEKERFDREETERLRLIQEEDDRKKEEDEKQIKRRSLKKAKKDALKKGGKYMTPSQMVEQERIMRLREQMELKEDGAQAEETVKTNTSNVVKRTKKKKVDEQPVANSNKTEVIQEDKQSEILQEPSVGDDWESILDEGTGLEKSAKPIMHQVQKVALTDAEIQQEIKKQQKGNDAKKLDSKVNKALFSMYQNQSELRSPICCILGHVDTGKTTLLDKIRNTNVQEGEAGGITQQIGATFFPGSKLIEELLKTKQCYPVDCNVPGLLIIDTPGHESFSNLRQRGSSLCDLAILVIDLMHGLEKQTLESIELLRMRKTPFVIALNKIDRCFEWQKRNMACSYEQLEKQRKNTKQDYEHRTKIIFTQLAEMGFNAAHYWENDDPRTVVSVIPTSGITGEGIPDLLAVIVKYTSIFLKTKMKVKEAFNCTVLERKVLEGHGSTIDCILVNGILRKDDRIVLQGFSGPIITRIKAILTPHPMKEMRVKGEYLSHDVLYASMGLKIDAQDLDEAVAGSQLYLANEQDDLDAAVVCLKNDFDSVKQSIKLEPMGVGVAASTLGSLEALLQFLKTSNIPVSSVSVGPVSKDDVMKALKNVLLENPERRKKEFACMLVFDIKVLPEAKEYAEANQIKIFEANIIYHLFDQFMAYVKNIQEERKKIEGKEAIFPCILKPIQFFNKKEPIILGIEVEQGILKPNTPICVYNGEKLRVGVVESIEANHKTLKEARASTGPVAIRLKSSGLTAGRQFDLDNKFVSIISRHSIDMLKKHFKEELTLDEWQLVKDLKTFFAIM